MVCQKNKPPSIIFTGAHCNRKQDTATHDDAISSGLYISHMQSRNTIFMSEKKFVAMLNAQTLIEWDAATTHCNTLRHTATHCNTLQYTATHCNTLQRTMMQCHRILCIHAERRSQVSEKEIVAMLSNAQTLIQGGAAKSSESAFKYLEDSGQSYIYTLLFGCRCICVYVFIYVTDICTQTHTNTRFVTPISILRIQVSHISIYISSYVYMYDMYLYARIRVVSSLRIQVICIHQVIHLYIYVI